MTKDQWCLGMAELVLFMSANDFVVPTASDGITVWASNSDEFRRMLKLLGDAQKNETTDYYWRRRMFGTIYFDVCIRKAVWDGEEESLNVLQALRRRFDL